jgi:hypothetical protein
LILSGYDVDTITALSNKWELQDTSRCHSIVEQAKVLQKNQRFVDEFETVFGFGGVAPLFPYPTGEDRERVCWMTCVAGDVRNDEAAVELDWQNFQKRQWWIRWVRRLHVQNLLHPWLIVVIIGHILRGLGVRNPELGFRIRTERLINRKAACTESGYCGLVPGIAQLGDKIILAKGGKLPLVLRRVGTKWEFIGDSYIHGFMSGERWNREVAKGGECEDIVLV